MLTFVCRKIEVLNDSERLDLEDTFKPLWILGSIPVNIQNTLIITPQGLAHQNQNLSQLDFCSSPYLRLRDCCTKRPLHLWSPEVRDGRILGHISSSTTSNQWTELTLCQTFPNPLPDCRRNGSQYFRAQEGPPSELARCCSWRSNPAAHLWNRRFCETESRYFAAVFQRLHRLLVLNHHGNYV